MSDSDQNNRELSGGKDKKPEGRKVFRPARRRLTPGGIKLWFREMRSELKKVIWPTPKQVVNNSGIVAAAVVVIGALIAVYDFGAETLVKAIILAFQS